jgi:hypothetical protein
MSKVSVSEMQIPAIETKRLYLQQIKKMHERWTRQLEGRELNIHIKEMHAHMIGNELKEEEELQKCEETLKKREEELVIHERGLEKRKKSLACLSITLSSRPPSCNEGFYVLLSCNCVVLCTT